MKIDSNSIKRKNLFSSNAQNQVTRLSNRKNSRFQQDRKNQVVTHHSRAPSQMTTEDTLEVNSILSMINSSAQDASKMETELRQRERKHVELVQKVEQLKNQVSGLENMVKERDINIQKLMGKIQSKEDQIKLIAKEKENTAAANQSLKSEVLTMSLGTKKLEENFIQKMTEQQSCVERLLVAYKIQEDGVEKSEGTFAEYSYHCLSHKSNRPK